MITAQSARERLDDKLDSLWSRINAIIIEASRYKQSVYVKLLPNETSRHARYAKSELEKLGYFVDFSDECDDIYIDWSIHN